MKCAQAEKLLPLLAGDDLSTREAAALQLHLESCANCRQLVSEFEESRDWLHSFTAPQFDEAMLDSVRDGVLREIGQIEKRWRWLERIIPNWNPRFAFAASLALLLLITAFGLLAYRRQPPQAPKQDRAEAPKSGGNQVGSQPGEIRDEPDSRIVNKKPERRGFTRKPLRLGLNESAQPEAQTIEPDLAAQNTDPAKTDLATNREMTRIEFQTADPNIRIIWFASKTNAAPLSRP